jgi:diguanylate cyclase (GGDEF)-like protein/PAS domain S-box-containing protein
MSPLAPVSFARFPVADAGPGREDGDGAGAADPDPLHQAPWPPRNLSLEAATADVFDAHSELEAYKTALDRHSIVAVTDRSGTIVYANDRFCAISGYAREELIGQRHSIVNSGHHPRSFFIEMWQTIGRGIPWHGEICNRAKDGSLYWVDTTIVSRRNAAGAIDGFVSIRYDITRKKQAEQALLDEVARRGKAEALLRDLLETIPDGIIAFDADDRLTHFNDAYKSFYKVKAPKIVEGATFSEILEHAVANGQYRESLDCPKARTAYLDQRLGRHRSPGRPIIQQLSDGRWLQVQERRSKAGHTVGVCTDITEIKRAESTIKHQAERDPLTGLYNRTVLIERLSRALSSRRKFEQSGALILIDLDHFKDINDTLGHDAGDELLVCLAQRFTDALRRSDTVARIGGDEFAILLPQAATACDVEKVVGKLLRQLTEPVALGHRTIRPGCSMGVTFFPGDGQTPKDLLKNADIALYQAKARGRGNCCFFNPLLREGVERRQATADALRAALSAGAIGIAVQPQVRFSTRRHVGFEALARWHHAGRVVPPSEFVPIAEETGLIIPLGYSVLDQSLALVRALGDQGFDPGQIAVNVAASQLKQPDFAATVAALLAAHGLEPAALEVEVTENVLLDRSGDQIARSLDDLHALGVTIALDDFGTGHASLAHLKRFPVDRLKIDQSFVREIEQRSEDAIIVRAIINLAHNLGMEVVAEGIETQRQFEFLRDQGCDVGQGYLIGKPVPAGEAGAYCAFLRQAFRSARPDRPRRDSAA